MRVNIYCCLRSSLLSVLYQNVVGFSIRHNFIILFSTLPAHGLHLEDCDGNETAEGWGGRES